LVDSLFKYSFYNSSIYLSWYTSNL